MNTMYVVIQSQGDYSDHEYDTFLVTDSFERAEKVVRLLNEVVTDACGLIFDNGRRLEFNPISREEAQRRFLVILGEQELVDEIWDFEAKTYWPPTFSIFETAVLERLADELTPTEAKSDAQ